MELVNQSITKFTPDQENIDIRLVEETISSKNSRNKKGKEKKRGGPTFFG